MHHSVILCLGTNTEQTGNMRKAQEALRQQLPDIRFTRSLWTEPIGHDSPPYLNAMAAATTTMTCENLVKWLKQLEQAMGRTPADKQLHRVTIDIDVLQYDDGRMHPNDWNRHYIRQLVAEL